MSNSEESFKPFQSGTGICKPSTDYYNAVTIKKGGAKKKKVKRKASKRKTSKRKTSKRKTSKRKTSKRKTSKRKTVKRKTVKRKTSKRKTSKRKTSKRKTSNKRGGGYKSLIPIRSSTQSDIGFKTDQTYDQPYDPPTAVKSENFGVGWRTSGGSKKSKRSKISKRGGGENMGATGRPARYYDPNASDRSSMSADASRNFSHFRDLNPGPNATGQTGGDNSIEIHGQDSLPGVQPHLDKLKTMQNTLNNKYTHLNKGGGSSDWRTSQYSRSLQPLNSSWTDMKDFNAMTKTQILNRLYCS